MDPTVNWTQVVQVVLLALFVVFVSGGAITTTFRLIRYWHASKPIPLLLWRDVIARNGLAFPFGAILYTRVLREAGVNIDFAQELWWVVLTSLPAVIGAGYYLYCEMFVIEKVVVLATQEETADQKEDREMGDQRRLDARHPDEDATSSLDPG